MAFFHYIYRPRIDAAVCTAINLLVEAKRDSDGISRSIAEATHRALGQFIQEMSSDLQMAEVRWKELRRHLAGPPAQEDEEEEEQNGGPAGIKEDLKRLEEEHVTARKAFDEAVAMTLTTINDMRRLRGKKELAPHDTDDVTEMITIVLQLPTDEEMRRSEDPDRTLLSYQIRTATLPGIQQASFASDRYRQSFKVEDLDLDEDGIIF